MPKKRKDDDAVFLRGLRPYKGFISYMEKTKKVSPVELGRSLFETANAFYEEHGWFSFPAAMVPDPSELRLVAETQARYGKGDGPLSAADQLSQDLADGLRQGAKPKPSGSSKTSRDR